MAWSSFNCFNKITKIKQENITVTFLVCICLLLVFYVLAFPFVVLFFDS